MSRFAWVVLLIALGCGGSKPVATSGGATHGASAGGSGSGSSFSTSATGGSSASSGGAGTASTSTSGSSAGSSASSSGAGTGSTSTSGSSAGSSASSSTGGTAGGLPDPSQPGPFTFTELDDTFTVAATGDSVAIHCAFPTAGPQAGPYPVVVMGHGFQLPPSQYAAYLRQLASFGYVALTVDFPASIFGSPNHVNDAKDLLGGLDWAAGNATVGPLADVAHAGMSGHSLGGKLALLAAVNDARVKASITLDPVDGSMNCSASSCPDVAPLLPGLHIPTAFLGELTDNGGNDCAPAAKNFQTLYAQSNAPSIAVTVQGANHMSFLDDPSACGVVCSFCTAATVPDAQVHALSLAMVTAFYERHLRGLLGYDAYLTGAQAQARYVATGQATITAR